jgi:iron complex transport system substrate-binding protein
MKRILSPILIIALMLAVFAGCGNNTVGDSPLGSLALTGSMQLDYADKFAIDYYEGGYSLITLNDGSRFLVVPKEKDVPKTVASDIVVLKQPVENIYLAATSAMCLFDGLGRLDAVRLSGTKADGWYIENARKAMEAGDIIYAGKYSQPDYELLLSEGCSVAIESMMISHATEVKGKLEELGIPVFMDQSSLEGHPLGRTEWIKLYGTILGEEEKAEELFNEQKEYLARAEAGEPTGKTVAFFYISSSGNAVVRKSGDYVSKMIALAGGKYVFDNIGDPEKVTATVNLEMESFFAAAKDADYIIYNSTIGGEVKDMAGLFAKSSLLKEFSAVKEGNVWCTEQNMYQETTRLGEMVESFRKVFSGEADDLDELPYLYRLK